MPKRRAIFGWIKGFDNRGQLQAALDNQNLIDFEAALIAMELAAHRSPVQITGATSVQAIPVSGMLSGDMLSVQASYKSDTSLAHSLDARRIADTLPLTDNEQSANL